MTDCEISKPGSPGGVRAMSNGLRNSPVFPMPCHVFSLSAQLLGLVVQLDTVRTRRVGMMSLTKPPRRFTHL